MGGMGGPGGSEGGGPPSFGGSESGGLGGPPSLGGSESGELPSQLGRGAAESTESGSGAVGELFGESSGSTAGGPPSMGAGGMAGGGMFGGEDLSSVLAYTEAHGGGTIAVDSQSGASASIIESGAEVAGIGGFSGKESTVSAAWLEERIAAGDITWIYTSGLGGMTGGGLSGGEGASAGGAGGDTRTGSESAIDTVVESCTAIDSSAYGSSSESETSESAGGSGSGTLYKCGGS
jgi:hypothetical protein